MQGCGQTVLRLSAQNQGHAADAAGFQSRVFARPAATAEWEAMAFKSCAVEGVLSLLTLHELHVVLQISCDQKREILGSWCVKYSALFRKYRAFGAHTHAHEHTGCVTRNWLSPSTHPPTPTHAHTHTCTDVSWGQEGWLYGMHSELVEVTTHTTRILWHTQYVLYETRNK